MICKECNTLNSNDAKKCVQCGAKLISKSAAAASEKTKSGLKKPASSRVSKPQKQKSPKNKSPKGDKKSNLGVLLFILFLVLAGSGYYVYHLINSGQVDIEELKKNEQYGQYITMIDSMLTPVLSEYIPAIKEREEAKKAAEEAKKKKSELKKKSEVKKKKEKEPEIKRVKRKMQYYRALKDNMNMVLIPSGKVKIGSLIGNENEKPVHEVYVDEFYIDEHEVTVSQFRIFVEETGYKLPKHVLIDRFNAPRQPIVGVSFKDAKAYAKWAGKRLPTEYEWEKAARGGLEGLRYPYTNEMNTKIACYDLNPANDGPADVKSYEPNDYKLYDMDGNVSEWTSSVPFPYPGGKLLNEYGERYRTIRGGSWKDIKNALAVSRRDFKGKDWSGNNVGFRCVMDY